MSVSELKACYDAIFYAVGNESDRKLGIPGEDLDGVHSATEFVFWYNGHPDYVDRGSRLDEARRVAVIGNGNVAMDVARILGRDPEELASTDIAAPAITSLRASTVREVILVGRRGPAQAAYSPKEIQEIGKLESCDLVITPRYAALDPATEAWMAASSFSLSSWAFFSSIGYRGVPIPGVPFREDWGLIPNDAGRVLHEAGGQVLPGQYVVGWAKRGPSGLIGSNRPDSKATVEAFLEDLPSLERASGGSDLGDLLDQRGVAWVSWDDWLKLDAEELRLGEERGKVREKFISVPEMLAFLGK